MVLWLLVILFAVIYRTYGKLGVGDREIYYQFKYISHAFSKAVFCVVLTCSPWFYRKMKLLLRHCKTWGFFRGVDGPELQPGSSLSIDHLYFSSRVWDGELACFGRFGSSVWLGWADRKGKLWNGKGQPNAHESNLLYGTLRMTTSSLCLEGDGLSFCLGTKVCLLHRSANQAIARHSDHSLHCSS